MRICKAEFTIIDDDTAKLTRTEVLQMVFNVKDDENMIDAMIDYLSEEDKEKEKPKIIINH